MIIHGWKWLKDHTQSRSFVLATGFYLQRSPVFNVTNAAFRITAKEMQNEIKILHRVLLSFRMRAAKCTEIPQKLSFRLPLTLTVNHPCT